MSDFTFAEHGEDILVHRLLLWKTDGFYLDCGAYHPRRMSLTARLRAFGWCGMNIDADERVIELFERQVANDINLNVAPSAEFGSVTLRRYQDPVINTVSSQQMRHLDAIAASDGLFTDKLDEVVVESRPLSELLEEHEITSVDFMNLDIEGAELAAIEGFPWERIRPSVIACEIHQLDLYDAENDPVVATLNELGYRLQSYVFHTAVFIREDFDLEQCHRVPFEVL